MSKCGGIRLMSCRNLPKHPVPISILSRYQYQLRYRRRAGTGGTGIDVVPKLPKCPVPVLISYRTYRSVRYRYLCTELTEVPGTGIDAVPNLLKCPVPVLMVYRTYRSGMKVPYRTHAWNIPYRCTSPNLHTTDRPQRRRKKSALVVDMDFR